MMTYDEWVEKGIARFGANKMDWKFKCPSCDYVASMRDYKEAGAPVGAVAFSCIGRYKLAQQEAFTEGLKKGTAPCNYTGGGLFNINPVLVIDDDGEEHSMFDFAEV